MKNRLNRLFVTVALVFAMVLSSAGAAMAAQGHYDSYWKFWEQNIVYVGSGNGLDEPNDIRVEVVCYRGADSRFEVRVQYRAFWRWWNDENTRLVDCGELTTFLNPTRDKHTDYRVLVRRQNNNPRGISAKARAWWD